MALTFELKFWLLLSIPLSMLLAACMCVVCVAKVCERPWKRSETSEVDALSEYDVEAAECVAVTGHTCHVCLEDFGDTGNVIVLKCGHYYHKPCISQWLFSVNEEKRNCPTCRAPIRRRQQQFRDGDGDGDVVLDMREPVSTAIAAHNSIAQ